MCVVSRGLLHKITLLHDHLPCGPLSRGCVKCDYTMPFSTTTLHVVRTYVVILGPLQTTLLHTHLPCGPGTERVCEVRSHHAFLYNNPTCTEYVCSDSWSIANNAVTYSPAMWSWYRAGEVRAKKPSLTLNLGTNGLKVTSEPPPMVTYPSSGHARRCLIWLSCDNRRTRYTAPLATRMMSCGGQEPRTAGQDRNLLLYNALSSNSRLSVLTGRP
ncbi:hypothetical protein J6590_055718 [Homalodisca vitripennis]|nr:hypothetical protein J6590_055718 [Homalodisca vitripennis]